MYHSYNRYLRIGNYSQTSEEIRRDIERKVGERVLAQIEVVKIIVNLGLMNVKKAGEVTSKITTKDQLGYKRINLNEYFEDENHRKQIVYRLSDIWEYLQKFERMAYFIEDNPQGLEEILKRNLHKNFIG